VNCAKGGLCGPAHLPNDYYIAFGVAVMVGLASLPIGFSSAFLPPGEAPGFAGEPVGETTGATVGDAAGVVVAVGAGVVNGLFGTSGFGSQAPTATTLAAKTVDNMIDLLIVFSPTIALPVRAS